MLPWQRRTNISVPENYNDDAEAPSVLHLVDKGPTPEQALADLNSAFMSEEMVCYPVMCGAQKKTHKEVVKDYAKESIG